MTPLIIILLVNRELMSPQSPTVNLNSSEPVGFLTTGIIYIGMGTFPGNKTLGNFLGNYSGKCPKIEKHEGNER